MVLQVGVGVRPQLYDNEVLASPSVPTSPGSRLGSVAYPGPDPCPLAPLGLGRNCPNSGVSTGH